MARVLGYGVGNTNGLRSFAGKVAEGAASNQLLLIAHWFRAGFNRLHAGFQG